MVEINPWNTIGRIDGSNFDDLALANFGSKGVSKSCSVSKSGLTLNPNSAITLDLTITGADNKDQVLNMLGQNEKVPFLAQFYIILFLDFVHVEVRQERLFRV